jgi:Pyruvate/2-oxoacid:ferredoxin oxidoreductase delta subunit
LASFLDQMGRQFAEKCTDCGICLQECPVFPLTRFADIGPQAMMEKVTSLLREGKISEEAYEMAYCCAQGCARVCAAVCPEELTPRSAFAAGIVQMAKAGKPAPEPFYHYLPGYRYNAVNMLSAIQVKPAEARWFSKVPANPKQADVVFFAGCGASGLPYIVLEVVDILDKMGISYAVLAGGELCCGVGQMLVGDTEASQKASREVVAAISAFRPKQAVHYCLGCPSVLQRVPPQPDAVSFEHRWLSHWRRISRNPGRPRTDAQLRDLIGRMVTENRWGAPRIHGELLKLGFRVSERTVSRYVRASRPRRPPGASWKTFLDNHREVLAAMDFFTVPTLTLRLLYVLLVIQHDRRMVLHVNATAHPTAAWVTQQLGEAFPFERRPRYLLMDRDSIFSAEVCRGLRHMEAHPVRTSFQSP